MTEIAKPNPVYETPKEVAIPGFVKAENFLHKLREFKEQGFKKEEFITALFNEINKSRGNAFTLIKNEILHSPGGSKLSQPHESTKDGQTRTETTRLNSKLSIRMPDATQRSDFKITEQQFRDYLKRQKGGEDAFLKKLFNDGIDGENGVLKAFNTHKRDYIQSLQRRKRRKLINRRFSARPKENNFDNELAAVAEKLGKGNDLTFEELFNSDFYGENLQPNFQGIALHALSTWEYENRPQRERNVRKIIDTEEKFDDLPQVESGPEPQSESPVVNPNTPKPYQKASPPPHATEDEFSEQL